MKGGLSIGKVIMEPSSDDHLGRTIETTETRIMEPIVDFDLA